VIKRLFGLAVLSALWLVQTASAQDTDLSVPKAAPNQWFTGSLEAPSPALPKAGMLALEPYFIYQTDTGMYGNDGTHHAGSNDTHTLEALLLIKYAITNKLTVQAVPTSSHNWNDRDSSSGVGAEDLPLELQYRVKGGNYRNGSPSITLEMGTTLPTGKYDRLGSSVNGVGQGAYLLKQGVVLQSLFDSWGNHPVRIRAYASVLEPLSSPSVKDVSVYGTAWGFRGTVQTGISGGFGIGAEWALDRHWVFAFDVQQKYAKGYQVNGTNGLGNFASIHGLNQASTAIAPAVEYNFSARAGLIAGTAFTVGGRNTPSYVSPQIAVAVSF
jgi:hypothetical protein